MEEQQNLSLVVISLREVKPILASPLVTGDGAPEHSDCQQNCSQSGFSRLFCFLPLSSCPEMSWTPSEMLAAQHWRRFSANVSRKLANYIADHNIWTRFVPSETLTLLAVTQKHTDIKREPISRLHQRWLAAHFLLAILLDLLRPVLGGPSPPSAALCPLLDQLSDASLTCFLVSGAAAGGFPLAPPLCFGFVWSGSSLTGPFVAGSLAAPLDVTAFGFLALSGASFPPLCLFGLATLLLWGRSPSAPSFPPDAALPSLPPPFTRLLPTPCSRTSTFPGSALILAGSSILIWLCSVFRTSCGTRR